MIAPLFGSITRPLLSPLVSGLRDELFGAFTPRSLFNDGSIGVLYDNNDLTTMFVDAAGTTPATVNGLVGLQLDKSQGLALSAEKVTNSDFSDASGWTLANGAGGSATISGGVLTLSGGSATYPNATQTCLTVGKWYEITIVKTSGTLADSAELSLFAGSGNQVFIGALPSGTHKFRMQAITNGDLRVIRSSGYTGATVVFDSISAKELPGNHRYQTTTGSKPVLRGTPTGAELFTAYGTPGAGWSVAGATGTATTASSALPTTTAAVVGKHYRVTYTVTRSAGSVQLSFGGRTGVSRSAAGQYVEYFDNALNTNALTATGTGFTGTVRIDEVKDVSAGSVTAPYGLQYDGVDDFLQTASVNFSATDKMFVCAGVRKLSDAAAGYPVNNGNGLVAGTFYLAVPASSAGPVAFYARGSVEPGSTAVTANFPAPVTQVITCAADIAADSRTVRVNGAAAGSSAADLGTGSFANVPIYFGRLLGASGPYNGLDFGFVIVGKTLTASQISSTERWIAQRTGVTL